MEFRTAIVDELGHVVAWCSDLNRYEEMELLANHPEWSVTCIAV